MSEREVSRVEAFAPALKRHRQLQRITIGAFLTFFLLIFSPVVLQRWTPVSPQVVVPLALIAWLTIVGGAILTNWVLRCPLCEQNVVRGAGEHCPECGSRSIRREHWWEPRTCSTCGCALRFRGRGRKRLFKVRYCGQCGCRLHEQGF